MRRRAVRIRKALERVVDRARQERYADEPIPESVQATLGEILKWLSQEPYIVPPGDPAFRLAVALMPDPQLTYGRAAPMAEFLIDALDDHMSAHGWDPETYPTHTRPRRRTISAPVQEPEEPRRRSTRDAPPTARDG